MDVHPPKNVIFVGIDPYPAFETYDLQVSTGSFTLLQEKMPRAFSRTKSIRRRGFTGL